MRLLRWSSLVLLGFFSRELLAQGPDMLDAIDREREKLQQQKDSVVHTVEVDGKKFSLAKKVVRKLMNTVAKAATKTSEEPTVKKQLAKLISDADTSEEEVKSNREQRVQILRPIWTKALSKICAKYGFRDFMQALRACMKFTELSADKKITEGVQTVLAIIEGKEEVESTREEAEVLWKDIRDLAMRFTGRSELERKEDLRKAEQLRHQLTFGGTIANPGADIIVETMEAIIQIGEEWVEDEMVELYPNVTKAVKGTTEHGKVMQRVETLAFFISHGAQRRVSKRMEAQKQIHGDPVAEAAAAAKKSKRRKRTQQDGGESQPARSLTQEAQPARSQSGESDAHIEL